MRKTILDLFGGVRAGSQPAFSGLIHVTQEGLERDGLLLHEVHLDARKMARAAAGTFRRTGLPSAALPLDLCLPAEALGAELHFHRHGENQWPQVRQALVQSVKEIGPSLAAGGDFLDRGRIPLSCEAIRLTRGEIGRDAVISGMIPGPYTLLLYLCNPVVLFQETKKEPESVAQALDWLGVLLARLGNAYLEAGADFITIHDMGGSPAFIGPARYQDFVQPAEAALVRALRGPKVLSVCGEVSRSLHRLAATGADAISLDQTVDLAAARGALKDTLLFGNIDPVQALWKGDGASIGEAVRRARDAGVDAVWPGCDLVPDTPLENLRWLSG